MAPDLKPGPEMDRAVAEAVGTAKDECEEFDDYGNCLCCDGWHLYYRHCGDPPDVCIPRASISTHYAIAALEATGERFMTEKDVENFPKAPWKVIILTLAAKEPAGFAMTLPEAACLAILAWSKAKEEA